MELGELMQEDCELETEQGSLDSVDKLHEEVSELRKKLAQQEKRHAAEMKTERDDFEKKFSTLTGTVGRTRQLTAMLLNNYPSDFDPTIETRLRDARALVVAGFNILFPSMSMGAAHAALGYFGSISINHPARKLSWKSFQGELAKHYWLHMLPNSDKNAMDQIHSAFNFCDCEGLLNCDEVYHRHGFAEDSPAPYLPPPNSQVFERVHVCDLDRETMRPSGFSRNDFMRTQLQLFIPVFIWAYNELRRGLLPSQQRFASLTHFVNLQLSHLRKLGSAEIIPPLDPPIFCATRMDLGVALETRKGQYCKEYLGIAPVEVPTDGKGEVKGEIEAGMGITGTSSNVEGEADQDYDRGNISLEDAPTSTLTSLKRRRVTFELQEGKDDVRSGHLPRLGSDPPETPFADNPFRKSILSKSMSSTQNQLVVEPDFVELPLPHAKAALYKDFGEIQTVVKRATHYTTQLDAIRKCLAILLDENLLNFVVHATLSFREAQGEKIGEKEIDHAVEADMETVLLKRVQDVVKIQEKRKKLSDLVDDKESFKESFTTERGIDEYLDGELDKTGARSTLRHAKTDLYVLLSWLEDAFPEAQKV
ncbi:hypothetical protein SCHPADRAFT_417049 [Schizopora paradoxa]|uniref:Uncharacterized protein n=1 Tax=Schizopora paradoxa TaxID=27342 RepID=A0A0H2S6L3_9AGAM|nr:hypothetical protein SCHPADRAFT_417049 [Schizopora paradoxa]